MDISTIARFIVGIDSSADYLTAAVRQAPRPEPSAELPQQPPAASQSRTQTVPAATPPAATPPAATPPAATPPAATLTEVDNTTDGYGSLIAWLDAQQIRPDEVLFCIENTGVYSAQPSYWLHQQGYAVVVIAPQHLKVLKPDRRTGSKTDRIDAQKIIEYAERFSDRLELWQPPEQIIQQIQALLSARELLVTQRGANKNAQTAQRLSPVSTPQALRAYGTIIDALSAQIKELDRQIQQLLDSDDDLRTLSRRIGKIPGVSWLLAANLAVLTNGFTQMLDARQIAAYCGICPYEHQSGSSVHRPSKSRGFGPSRLRKLLHLASLSVRQHTKRFACYYEQKKQSGKPSRLILNNIANKLLQVIIGVINSGQDYSESYRSPAPKHAR